MWPLVFDCYNKPCWICNAIIPTAPLLPPFRWTSPDISCIVLFCIIPHGVLGHNCHMHLHSHACCPKVQSSSIVSPHHSPSSSCNSCIRPSLGITVMTLHIHTCIHRPAVFESPFTRCPNSHPHTNKDEILQKTQSRSQPQQLDVIPLLAWGMLDQIRHSPQAHLMFHWWQTNVLWKEKLTSLIQSKERHYYPPFFLSWPLWQLLTIKSRVLSVSWQFSPFEKTTKLFRNASHIDNHLNTDRNGC